MLLLGPGSELIDDSNPLETLFRSCYAYFSVAHLYSRVRTRRSTRSSATADSDAKAKVTTTMLRTPHQDLVARLGYAT